MNIEELSKSQLLLLTILVNFVTAIATGILTVSLLDQAPPVVTKTVNQIVDHTIQTVAAAAPIVAPAPAPSNQDLVVNALADADARLVSIYGASGTSSPAIAVGTYLPESRAVATAALAALPAQALIVFSSGTSSPASLSHEGSGIAIYGFSDTATLPSAPTPALVSSTKLALGETVLAIDSSGSASTGIVSQVGKSIQTTLGSIGTGVAAVDLSGDIVGIASGASAGSLISADEILTLLTATSSATSSASRS